MSSEPRLLIISHGHPDFSLGGAEIAAHAHWSEMRRRGIETMLVARVSQPTGHTGTPFSTRSPDGLEVLFSPPPVDHFRHSQLHPRTIYQDFRGLLERFRPTAVHFHHYVHMGLELLREVRKYDSKTPILMTLHEYLAICHAQGQMLKTNGLLCRKAAPLDCHVCFPNISPQEFFLRELFVKSFLELVDRFICPSQFLRDRYIAWGLPSEKMIVIENGQPRSNQVNDEESSTHPLAARFVVLGQLSRLKGTLVLLEAVRLLHKRIRKMVRIELHGSVQYADEEFKTQLAKALVGLEETIHLCGSYLPEDSHDILRRNGWLIVPSIWWENSPLVIQEAFAAGRPVICSNIGGMQEKVTHGVNGLHFRVHNAADLAMRIEECASRPDLWEALRKGVPRPPSIEESVGQLLALYQDLSLQKRTLNMSSTAMSGS